jgi:hypothetical protein
MIQVSATQPIPSGVRTSARATGVQINRESLMSFKRCAFAVAIAAASVPAVAAISDQASGNGELFLAVSNPFAPEAQRFTYVLDLGIAMDAFLPVSSSLGVTAASTQADTSFTVNLPSWSSFVSQITGAGGSFSDLRFGVFALDGTGTNSAANPNNKRLLFTTNATATDMTSSAPNTDAFQNSDLNLITGVGNALPAFVGATNALSSHSGSANGVSINQRQGAVDQADFSNAFLDSLGFTGSQLNFAASSPIADLARFAYAGNAGPGTGSYNSRAVNAISYSLDGSDVSDLGSGLAATFGIVGDASSASLVYTAPIPEPGEWAFMIAGLSLAGMIARRRRAARA